MATEGTEGSEEGREGKGKEGGGFFGLGFGSNFVRVLWF